ncbi:MAG: hypothetical protein ABEI58_01050 [Candidatus Nanohaloarchaea archaeon]
MIRRMIKEEWRMHSAIYRGRSFAFFPLLVFMFSLTFTWLTVNYSTLEAAALGNALEGLGVFLGLAVGSVGFSSMDAMRNVLGPMNLLVYSSRTLPVSERKLLFDFIVKDILYYTALFILPVSLGVVIPAGTGTVSSAFNMFSWFLAALLISVAVARSSLRLPSTNILNYRRMKRFRPLTSKSVLDVARSSGGLLKVVFSLAVLTGFYWFTVLYFPVTRLFLENPLLSFSAVVGILNLSIYNWINRFDSIQDYLYLPVVTESLLEAKKQAFVLISVPMTFAAIMVSYVFYPGNLLLGLATGLSMTFYTLFVASWLTGLHPNERLFDSRVFLKYLAANSLAVVPVLIFTVYYTPAHFTGYMVLLALITAAGVAGSRHSG